MHRFLQIPGTDHKMNDYRILCILNLAHREHKWHSWTCQTCPHLQENVHNCFPRQPSNNLLILQNIKLLCNSKQAMYS